MAPRTRLRAVTDADAAPPPPPPLTLVQAAKAGDDVAELKALRVICATAMQREDISGRDLAALSRRQVELGREIRALEALERQEGEDGDGPAEDEALDASAI